LPRIEPAPRADPLVAVIDKPHHVRSRRANPKFLGAFVRAPADASAIERCATPPTQSVPLVVERPAQRLLRQESDEAVRFQERGYFRMRRPIQTGFPLLRRRVPAADLGARLHRGFAVQSTTDEMY
jgi:hypothetical protein